jgi:hypothetical protein
MHRNSVYSRLIVLAALAAAVSAGCGMSGAMRRMNPQPLPVKYAAMDIGSEEPLVFVFETTEGTASGYDVAYLDFGLPPSTATAQKITANPAWSGANVTCSYSPVRLQKIAHLGEDRTPAACEVNVCTCRQGDSENYCITVTRTAQVGADAWQYTGRCTLQPSVDPAQLKPVALTSTPTLAIQTRPDSAKPGQLGIGLSLTSAGMPQSVTRNGQMPDAEVVIRKPSGEVVHQATESLDQFAFG